MKYNVVWNLIKIWHRIEIVLREKETLHILDIQCLYINCTIIIVAVLDNLINILFLILFTNSS